VEVGLKEPLMMKSQLLRLLQAWHFAILSGELLLHGTFVTLSGD
jgi:hypothetical protein